MKHLFASLSCLVFFLSCGLANAAQPAPAATPPQQAAQAQQPQLSPTQAFALMAGEAEKGDTQAMLNLGSFYEQGVGVPRNFVKALEWYEKAAKAGLVEGIYNVGVCYEVGIGNTGDMPKALKQFEEASAKGLAQADYKLSTLYATGHGVKADEAKAFDFLQKAANANLTPAMNDLALVYARGLMGQKADPAKAFAMFTASAEAGNVEAMKNLAVAYKEGVGTKADTVAALRWVTIAKIAGHPQDLTPIIADLKKGLKAAQIKDAETKAGTWVKAFVEKMQKEAQN